MSQTTFKLIADADLSHEDAREWYGAYGWHISTENEGDVDLGAVEFDWLDGTDEEAIAKLRETYDGLTDDEAEAMIARARMVREAGEAVEELLSEAVEAYQSGDVNEVIRLLDEAARVEREHGDSPAANSLRSELIEECEPESYDALIGSWNGACYETCERVTLDAETLEDAIAEVQAMTFGDEDYDIEVTIEDQDGNTVHTESFQHSVAQSQQEDMDETWEDKGEFTTDHLGVKDDKWFVWESNGGTRGAHDRMDGSGRWIESYEEPQEVSLKNAHEWLVKNAGMDTDEALDTMEEHDSENTKADIVREIGECLWSEDKFIGVYRVRKTLYTMDFSEVCEVTDEEATDFVADHDEDAVEKFEERL